jgi:hypothetical protein
LKLDNNKLRRKNWWLVENFYYVCDSVCQATLKKFFNSVIQFCNSIERVIRPIFINLKETFCWDEEAFKLGFQPVLRSWFFLSDFLISMNWYILRKLIHEVPELTICRYTLYIFSLSANFVAWFYYFKVCFNLFRGFIIFLNQKHTIICTLLEFFHFFIYFFSIFMIFTVSRQS